MGREAVHPDEDTATRKARFVMRGWTRWQATHRRESKASCRWAHERLWPLADGELPQPEQEKVTAHLEECAACVRAHRATLGARASLRPAAPPSPGGDVAEMLAAAVAERLAAPSRPSMVPRTVIRAPRWGIAAALAVALLAVIAPRVLRPGAEQEHPLPGTAPARGIGTTIAQGKRRTAEAPRVSPAPQAAAAAPAKPAAVRGAATQVTKAVRPRVPATPRRVVRPPARRAGPSYRPIIASAPASPGLSAATPPAVNDETAATAQEGIAGGAWEEPVMIVREMEDSAPSYAFARCATPSEDGSSTTVVEITRERSQPEEPVRVTLVMSSAAEAATKERLP